MLITTLQTIFNRDLNRLSEEIALYQDEKNIWLTEKSIANSAGNLCLHLIGNLNTYIGAVYGNTGYIRYRELEFSQKNIPRNELLVNIQATIDVVNNTLEKMKDIDLSADYPLLVFKEKTSTEYFLAHLTTHLAYHLGQINYHRRLLDC
jgi:uncharacterized damage-inducible protein DinB